MSYKQNIVISNGPVQLVDKSRFGNSVSQGGVTCTNNGDGSWTINGNVTAENRFNLNFYQLGANVIPYWLSPGVPVEHNYYTQDCYYDKLGGWLYYYLEEGKNYENFKIYPQIISLTDTFGSGNEPKNKEQVKAKLPDNLYPYNPTNRVTTYKELIKVSDVCQLLDKSKYIAGETVNGVTYINNGDGTFTVNSLNITANTYEIIAPSIALIKGHKYAVSLYGNYVGGYFYIQINKNGAYQAEINNGIYEVPQDNYDAEPRIVAYLDTPTGDKIYKPQFFDLTEMYGSGNEPSTIEEFKEKFPDELYPYSPNCWLTSYKNVSKVGKVCQLLDKSTFYTFSRGGTTATYNNDGTFTVSGTATADDWKNFPVFQLLPGGGEHVYLFDVGAMSNSSTTYCNIYFYDERTDRAVFLIQAGGTETAKIGIADAPQAYQARFNITTLTGATPNNIVYKPQLFDLTEMYGAGNEPKTVTEFREKFPEELYDYSPRCII